jgi:hypothetical protein
MVEILMLVGFMLAAYSVVGNDSIQTLGTFLYSNSHRPWWVLWIYSSTIMVGVILYGWFNYNHDPSYSRLNKVYGKSIDVAPLQVLVETAKAAVAEGPTQAAILQELDEFSAHLTELEATFTARPQDLDASLRKLERLLAPIRKDVADPTVPNAQRVAVGVVVDGVVELQAQIENRRDVSKFINWRFLLPPLVLLLLTRYGFPVSTSFLVLITFQPAVLPSMMIKSLSGYVLAFWSRSSST